METCDIPVKEIASIYDKEGMRSFVSLYYNEKDIDFINRRVHLITSILKGKELENFKKTMESIQKYLRNRYNIHNLSLFASDKHKYFKAYSIPEGFQNALVVSASPYIRYLVRLKDEWKPFTLILINSNHAKIFSIACGEVEKVDDLSTDIMNKHKKGGMSQARFQRIRKGNIDHFLKEVAEDLKAIVKDYIIIAGPGQTKKQFLDFLPKIFREKVIDVIDISIENEHELFKESFVAMEQHEEKRHDLIIKQIQKEILTHGLATYGISETYTATKEGKVEILLVEVDYKQKGWMCGDCGIIESHNINICHSCGNKLIEIDIVEKIIEEAEKTDAHIDFTRNEEIKKLGHTAALLRYK